MARLILEAADARRANAVLEIRKDRARNLRPRESLAGIHGRIEDARYELIV